MDCCTGNLIYTEWLYHLSIKNKQTTSLWPIGKGRIEGGASGGQKDSGRESGMGGVARKHGRGQKQGTERR